MADAFGTDYGGGGSGNFSQNQGGSPQAQARKPTDEKTIVPATIKMLGTAVRNNMMFDDGREPDQVKIVAAIREVSKGSASYTYTVEDGTGCMEIKEWIDDESNLEKAKEREESAVENNYIRIFGKLGMYDDKPQIVAHCIRKLSSGNELTYHFLEVVHAAETYKKSSSIVGSPSMAMQGMKFNQSGGGMNNGMHTSTPLGNNQNGGDGGDALENDIIAYLRTKDQERGGSMQEFIENNAGKYTQGEMTNKFNVMSGEGNIYSTIDDEHFSCV
mmetsp:Transcript_13599/g.20244  ORF Transcript_13599/g.20244 Transcript_13599/m.20244 type:complete len:273 (-) Transcript_13599:324-1142(-)|eukprot:CAMPEP_0194093554 /NCGR_PEP_ID=MMETSP0149-20130528/50749_1 /TAXON_ID=122233 /ORGANISM="Chaetoceros debilis, Strain MM31A-1" /LENGTH=272 /DNA_ID=CAMNT_0038778895 /DNA_START=152 /DNA_END=970 /DNA_ORIENTATION=+